MRKSFKQGLLGAAAIIALASYAGTADAAIITDGIGVVFSWDPNAVGAGNGTASALTFSGDNIHYTDYANATIFSGTNFTETGVLQVDTISLAGVTTSITGALGGGYGLYFQFTVTGTGSFNASGNYQGSISNVSYSMLLDPHTGDTITNSGSNGPHTLTDGGTADIVLATGSLTNGPNPNIVSVVDNVPTASANTTFNAANSPFFVNPTGPQYLLMDIILSETFTNTTTVETTGPCSVGSPNVCIDIHGGNGNATFSVPEPTTLSIFGAALLGLGFAKRRKNKKAA
jgi:hypothetical protein